MVFALGLSLIFVNQIVYVSIYVAYTEAITNWLHNRALNMTDTTPPAFEAYGIGTNDRIISGSLEGAMIYYGIYWPNTPLFSYLL